MTTYLTMETLVRELNSSLYGVEFSNGTGGLWRGYKFKKTIYSHCVVAPTNSIIPIPTDKHWPAMLREADYKELMNLAKAKGTYKVIDDPILVDVLNGKVQKGKRTTFR